MASDQRTAKVLLQWQTDNASITQSVAANKGGLAAIRQQADADYTARVAQLNRLQAIEANGLNANRALYDADYQARVDHLVSIAAQTNQSTQAVVKQQTEVQDLTDLYKALDDQAKNAQATIHDIGLQNNALPNPEMGTLPGEGGGSSTASTLRGLSQSAIALPGVGFQSPLVLGLRGASAIADKTGASFLQLGAAGVILGGTLVAVKVFTDQFNKTLEDSKKLLTGALSANQNYYNALATMTSEEVKKQIGVLEAARPALEQSAAGLQNAIDSAFKQYQAQFGDAAARALVASGKTPITQLQEELDKVNAQIQDNTQTTTRYTQGLNSNAFATNDAAEAEKKLQKAREDTASQLIADFDQEANTRTRLAELRRTGTTDQVNAELDTNKDRETIIRNFLLPAVASLGLGTEAAAKRTQELNDELTNLQHNDKLLVDAVLPVVQQREAEVALLKAQKDQSDALNQVLQDINKTQVDLAAASQKTVEAMTAVQQAETDHANNLIDIQAKYAADQMTALQKKNDALAKIDANAAERALEQRENLNLQIEGLVARGQIAEAQQAIRAQKLKEEQDVRQVQQQKDDAQKNYADALKAAADQRDKLLKSEQERYAKERQQRLDAYNKAVQDQQFLQNRLQSLRDQEQAVTRYWISATVTALYKVQDATGNFAAQMQTYANQINGWVAGGGAAWRDVGAGGGTSRLPIGGTGQPLPGEVVGLPAVTGTAAGRGGSSRTITAYATGTNYVPRDMLAFLHRGEAVIPASQNNGGASVVFNIDASGSNISEAEWQRRLEPVKVEVVQKLTEIHNRQKR